MKTLRFLIALSLLIGSLSFAGKAATPEKVAGAAATSEKRQVAQAEENANCEEFTRGKIIEKARKQGLKMEFGFELMGPEIIGKGKKNEPLMRFLTSHFNIEDGYLNGSGASVVVHKLNGKCELISINVENGH